MKNSEKALLNQYNRQREILRQVFEELRWREQRGTLTSPEGAILDQLRELEPAWFERAA